MCFECDHKRPRAAHSSEISAEPICDDGGYLRKLTSLNSTDITDKSQFRQSPTRAADKWRFVNEGDDGCNRLNSWNEASGLVGFPVTGGKTELSQNLQKKGLVEVEDVRSKGVLTHKANNNEPRFVKIPKKIGAF